MTVVDLHHVENGPTHPSADAPVLVLGGSLGTRLAMWDPLLPLLTDTLRIVRFDLRGHGTSPGPPGPYAMEDLGRDVLALLDHLGIERASYAGLSIGGMIGTWLGAHAGERFDHLVLMCSSAHVDGGPFEDRAQLVRDEGSVESLADQVVGRWLTPDYAAAHPDQRDWLREMLATSPPEGYAGCCEAIAAMDLREDARTIAVPTLVISGAQDASIPPEHQRELVELIPGARLAVVDPAAHVCAVERPDEIARLVLEHVAGAA